MGYITRVTGEFAITPPLTWDEIMGSRFHVVCPDLQYADGIDLGLRIHEESTETPEGTLIRRTAAALVMPEIDEYRAYTLIEQVQRVVDMFPAHDWTGRLDCEGEDNTDVWRVVIRDGRALKIEPRIVWPDEDGAL
jgi:hypothetical protein